MPKARGVEQATDAGHPAMGCGALLAEAVSVLLTPRSRRPAWLRLTLTQ